MTDYIPVTLKQLQFFNTFIYQVRVEDVRELAPGIAEFKVGMETPAFAPLTTTGYIWLDADGTMIANAVTEKVPRPYPRHVNDPERFRNYDFPIKVRMFPNWRVNHWQREKDMIEKTYPQGHMSSFPGADSAVKFARDWINEQLESEVPA